MNNHYFLKNSKIHSALTIAPTENLHEYKIVERHDFQGEKKSDQVLFLKIS